MTDTEIVPRKSDLLPADRPPLVDAELADGLLARVQSDGVELLGPDGLLSQVTKAVLERALTEEMTQHLGYERHDPAGRGSGNSRNGVTGKRLLTEIGGIDQMASPSAAVTQTVLTDLERGLNLEPVLFPCPNVHQLADKLGV